MGFLTEAEPARGVALDVLPGIRRVVAANPGVMTYHGTNTYLIDGPDGPIVLDPGPDNAGHVADVLRLAGAPVALILLSHTHHDHVGAVPAMKQATGAPVAAWHRSALDSFSPDIALEEGSSIAGFTAIFTPGHAADHVCFAGRAADGQALLFSADHVMSWSSSVVSPPGGNMADYFASLRKLLARGDDGIYLPGHGPPLAESRALVAELLAHREKREAAIHAKLAEAPATPYALMDTLYSQTNDWLRRAAERNVLAHLLKLAAEGRARQEGDLWVAV